MTVSPSPGVAVSAEACFTAIDKALKTINLYMGKGDLAVTAVDVVHESMTAYLLAHERLVFDVTAHGLSHEGRVYATGKQSSRYYFYLFKDGVRELAFDVGIALEEIWTFLQIFIDRHHDVGEREAGDEGAWAFRDQDSVTRLWEADLPHVRYHAIDVYAAGELMDPERGVRRSLAEMVAERMQAYRPVKGPAAGSVAGASPPAALRGAGWVPLEGALLASEKKLVGMRQEAARDDLIHMDRFAIIWARLVQTAPESDRPLLVQLMLKTFRAWVDEGNWDAMHRGLKILQALAALPEHRAMVQHLVMTIAQPEELQRLQPAVLETPPETVPKVVIFFGALGQKAALTLSRLLADLEPGPLLAAYREGFVSRGLDPLPIELARLRSKDAEVVMDAMRMVSAQAADEGVREGLRLLLARRDSQLRLAALKLLGADQDRRTLQALHHGLVDTHQKIRSHAIRTLGTMRGNDVAARALLERIASKPFRSLHPMERHLLLTSVLHVGGDAVIGWFRGELGRHSLFAAKKLRAWRAELQGALAEAGTEEAAALLAEVGDA